MGSEKLEGRMEMLTVQINTMTDWISESQHYLGDLNGDLGLAEGVRGACEGMRLMLHHIGGIREPSVSTYGVTPLMSP